MQESVLTGYGVVGFMYPGRDPARGRTVAQGSPAAQGSPVAHKSHGAVGLSAQNTLREKRLALGAALREVAWPFDGRAAVRRPTHQTSVESPSRGRRYGSGSRWGGVVP